MTEPTQNLGPALAHLSAGELVVIPTETVYGLAADARNGTAIAKIYALKHRPAFNPLIAHVPSRAAAEKIAIFNDRARRIADIFWPGPLTLILPLHPGSGIDPLATAGLATIGVRVPAHPLTRALLQAFDAPLVAPSANPSGTLSPTNPAHVQAGFGDKTPYILMGGAAPVGLESTILDLTTDLPVILRPGAVTPEDLAAVLGFTPDIAGFTAGAAPKSPGQLLQHYAPRTPLRLRAIDVARDEGLLAFGNIQFMGVRGGGFARDLTASQVLNLSETGDLTEAAARLFRYLHELDAGGWTRIAVMDIPNIGIGVAIHDRLRRAAGEA